VLWLNSRKRDQSQGRSRSAPVSLTSVRLPPRPGATTSSTALAGLGLAARLELAIDYTLSSIMLNTTVVNQTVGDASYV